MQAYGLNELRNKFLDFFEKKGHLKLDSFSLIPNKDKSLLLINSGMAPLKPYFTGQETPPRNRVTTCQKCIRTPDIENVGKTARHGTFFEMLGNFSFGDYFKEEAIEWAWEFLTEELGIDKDLLYVTVYLDDDEAHDIWKDKIGLEESRIIRMGKEDNFWEIGLGPCGPCSEIYVDRGESYGCGKEDCGVGCSCDRFVEIWNLVFTQFDKDEAGNYNRLAKPNIDTGMGLERLAVFCQGADNLFEADTIRYILDYVCSITGKEYKKNERDDVSIRVITDHIRSIVFMLADGVMPSNEGRGYVLRRLLRRAVRHGKLLGAQGEFLADTALRVIETSAQAYPNLTENKESVLKIIEVEERKFADTINQGISLIRDLISRAKDALEERISGENAFRLYDTYGFPLELTLELAQEEGMTVDLEAYEKTMQVQKNTAREAHRRQAAEGWRDEISVIISSLPATEFAGYETLQTESRLLSIIAGNEPSQILNEGDSGALVFDRTPFYAESGGQVGDIGLIVSEGTVMEVYDTIRNGDKHIHLVNVTEGTAVPGGVYTLQVNSLVRLDIQRNHTATHLLHKALKMVLGSHVNQAGSEVSASRLRFDFSHYEKIEPEQIAAVENIVNEQILKCLEVTTQEMNINDAKRTGAAALFGEKYADTVRVVSVDGFSSELCGGCHLNNTGFAGMFKIVSESSIAAGVRRIEAVTGSAAIKLYDSCRDELNEAARIVKGARDSLISKIGELVSNSAVLQKRIEQLQSLKNSDTAEELLLKAEIISGVNVIISGTEAGSANELRELCDKLRDKLGSGIVFLMSSGQDKANMICAATKDLAGVFSCGEFIKAVASSVGSGGGGRADLAQAGLKDVSSADQALKNAGIFIREFLSRSS